MANRNKLLSLFVAVLMLLSTVFTGIVPAFADETDEPAAAVTEPDEPIETADAEPIDPESDTDGDGVKDVDEIEYFGTDPENADTDSDGLSDYDELYVYHTAPGEQDSDCDGLSDYDELQVNGTDPLNGDTDSDGLSDGDELIAGTDPKNQDTDGDGIMDGDELLLGTDPFAFSDLKTVFQTLGKGMTDGELINDNAAVPAIEGYAPFVLYREAVVMHYGVESFLKNPALIGKPVEIRMPEGGDLVLTFTVESNAKEIAVFRMNDAGTIRLNAEQNGKAFTVPLTENGVYYVADLHKLNTLLGFEGAGVQNLPANTVLLEDFRYVTLSEPLTAGSSVDTDGDGIPDCEEIGDRYEIDLGNGYTANVYGYVSDPTLVDSDFDGMRDGFDELPRSNSFSGQYKSGDYKINLTYTMDYQNFLGNNKVYSAEIASFSVWAAQLCYENEDNEVSYTPNEPLYDSNGSAITTVRRVDSLMRAHGMENVIDYQLENGYFDSDISLGAYADDNITEVFLGHHKMTADEQDYEIITVFVRGTNGTEKEWCSNFDVGDLQRYLDDYDCVEGKQPRQLNADWNRKSNHRGFDICATRIYRALATYMNTFVDPDATPIFWLTGHSRGAAISNIISASCVDEGHKVFAYTYASPNTTANTEASAEKYDCIFNLVNGDDFVPMLPMPEWGFTRYGRTAKKYACLATNSERSTLLGNTSYSYASDSSLAELVGKFANMTKNSSGVIEGWRDVYVYHCYGTSGIDHVEVHQHAGETIGEFRSGSRKDYGTDSNWNGYNEHTKKYSYCVKDKDGGLFGLGNKWSCCQTPAYAMQLLAITMGNLGLSAGWSFLTSYDLASRFDFGKMSLITNYATKIIDPHYMENYYLIQYLLQRDSDPETAFSTVNSLYTNSDHRPVHEHNYQIVEIIQAPTCTEPGVAHVVCHCSEINSAWYDDEIKKAKIPALGHDWEAPAWTWDGVTAATATFVCSNDSTHVETVDAESIVRTENGDVVTYTATATFEGETYTDVKTVELGYYLVGSITDWALVADDAHKFVPNPDNAAEYMLPITLAEGAEFKAVRAEGDTIIGWYPDQNPNYVVGANQAGDVTVYFRPDGQGGDGWHYGYLYIAVPKEEPEFMSQSLLLADQLGVRFYVKLPAIEGYVYDRVDFTITGHDGDAYASSVAYSEDLPKNKAGHYGFTFYENTVQMADTITATLYYTKNGEQKTLVKEYAVKEYFEAFDAAYAEAPEAFTMPVVDMIKATADLGHYVQIYLDESRTEWSVENGDHAEMDKFYTTYTADDVAEATEAVASHALTVEGTCTDIKNLGFALYLDSATSLRVTIVPASGFTGTFTATVDGEEATVTKVSKTKYMVEVKGIMANGLSKKHTIVIGTENGSVTLTGSGLTYVQMMLRAGASNANIQNAAVAIYRYSKFADILKPE